MLCESDIPHFDSVIDNLHKYRDWSTKNCTKFNAP